MALAAHCYLDRELHGPAIWHAHFELKALCRSLDKVIDRGIGSFAVSLRVIRWKLLRLRPLPGACHSRVDLRGRNLFVAPAAYLTSEITVFSSTARER
jgi:hypothetical protein